MRLLAEQQQAPPSNEDVAAALLPSRDPAPDRSGGEGAVLGLEGMVYRLGGCCSPLPGELIVGTVALGNHGITIHRQDCSNVETIPRERRLPVRWNTAHAQQEKQRFPVQLRIEVIDRVGILKDCLLYTSPSPRDQRGSRMPSSA